MRLTGIIAATVLPFTAADEPDLPTYRQFISDLVGAGVGGLAVNADSGEGMSLWPAERRAVMRCAAEAAAGQVPVVSGVIASFTAQACRLAAEAAQDGAQALLVFPSVHLRGQPLDPEIPLRYLRRIHEASGLPIVAFQLQDALGGVEYAAETLAAMVEQPFICAIKESTFDAHKFRQTQHVVRQAAPGVSFLSGNDNFIYESFLLGCDGSLMGAGSVATELQVQLFQAVQASQGETAARLNERLEPLMEVIFGPPIRDYRARAKEALRLLGRFPASGVREPLLPVDEQQSQAIASGLKLAGLL
jgi:4-hydroxy-tetrahydrodipicolinate synthase